MRLIRMVAAALWTIALAGAVPAQDTAPAAEAQGGGAMAISPGGAFGGDIVIKNFTARRIELDAETGELKATGKVHLQTDQFEIKSEDLHTTDNNQKIIAQGSPVVLDDPVNKVHAECRNLVYNVKTKTMRLEGGNPFVTQEDESSITRIQDGIIEFTQSKSGKTGMTLLEDPKTGKFPVITQNPKKKPAAADAPKEPAQRVRNNNIEIIPKLPQTDQGR